MALVDLKMTPKDIAAEAVPEQNPYPFGACLNLDTDELAKLGITRVNLPAVGDEFHIEAVGKVTRVSENDIEGGDYSCGIGIQITAMELENEGHEDDQSVAEDKAEAAESASVGGGARTMLTSAYRGKK